VRERPQALPASPYKPPPPSLLAPICGTCPAKNEATLEVERDFIEAVCRYTGVKHPPINVKHLQNMAALDEDGAAAPLQTGSDLAGLEAEIDRLCDEKNKIYAAELYPHQERFEQLYGRYVRTESKEDGEIAARFDRESGREAAITRGAELMRRADALIKQVWSTPCQSDTDRVVKTRIFLKHIGGKEWCGPDRDLDWEIGLGRRLLIEFSSMSTAEATLYTEAPIGSA
jgi:hypothetical protein